MILHDVQTASINTKIFGIKEGQTSGKRGNGVHMMRVRKQPARQLSHGGNMEPTQWNLRRTCIARTTSVTSQGTGWARGTLRKWRCHAGGLKGVLKMSSDLRGGVKFVVNFACN